MLFIIVTGALVGVVVANNNMNLAASSNIGFGSPNGIAPLTFPIPGGNAGPANYVVDNGTIAMAQTTVTAMMTMSSTTGPSTNVVIPNTNEQSAAPGSSSGGNSTPNKVGSGFVEFFANITLQVASPSSSLKSVTTLAYSLGGYVAYSFAENTSALAVIRVPATNYQTAFNDAEALGNVTSSSSTSNDVSVKYTDLNATLQSYLTEQSSLIRLLNQSASVNQTLIIESQIQNVDAQINSIESSILQTRTLIDYSTITVSMNAAPKPVPPPKPLALKVTATPTSGEAPLSVTFNALVTGGVQPYLVNYNFGDGTSAQGQSLIHTFTEANTFNVTISVTDSTGNVSSQFLLITVTNPATHIGFSGFTSTVSLLFVSVVEGIVEVAVVILPLAAVAAIIIIPIRHRSKLNGNKKAQKGDSEGAGKS